MSGENENVQKTAAERGQTALVPGPRIIQIDIDNMADRFVLDAQIALLRDMNFNLEVVKETRSLNGGKHVHLRAPRDVSDVERAALQARLGSDRKRELMGLMEAMGYRHEAFPFMMFEFPEEGQNPGDIAVLEPKAPVAPEDVF